MAIVGGVFDMPTPGDDAARGFARMRTGLLAGGAAAGTPAA